MFKKDQYRIGWAYRLNIDGNFYDVTLISKEGRDATVLIQNHSIRTSLDGFSVRKKMYSQAVPIQHIHLSELQFIEKPKTRRGLGNWLRSKIHL